MSKIKDVNFKKIHEICKAMLLQWLSRSLYLQTSNPKAMPLVPTFEQPFRIQNKLQSSTVTR